MKIIKRKRRFAGVKTVIIAGMCLLAANEAGAVGQSAVITLGFPVGARPTAMGEAFTGLADDANAVFYNPAGLGQSPLTLSWKTHMADSAFTAIAARSSTEFGARDYIWAGSAAGIARFNGRVWERRETYLPEENESLRSIALKYFMVDEVDVINEAIWEIRKENKLGMRRYERLVALLESQAEAFAQAFAAEHAEAAAAAEQSAVLANVRAAALAAEQAAKEAEQSKPVIAIYGTIGDTLNSINKEINALLNDAIVKSGRYEAADRADSLFEQLMEDGLNYSFSNSDEGALSGTGKRFGVRFMAIVNLNPDSLDLHRSVSGQIMDVETAEVRQYMAGGTPMTLEEIISLAVSSMFNLIDSIKSETTKSAEVTEIAEPEEPSIPIAVAPPQQFNPQAFAKMLMLLPPNETVASHIAAQVLPQSMDAQHRVELAERIIGVLAGEDRGVGDVTELKIPYSIAVRDTVTAMALDASERLWVGTVSGLWRYHNNRWQRFTTAEGLPSNRITSVSVSQSGNVAVGTEMGLAVMDGREWIIFDGENGLPDSYVTSVAHVGNDQLYIGTPLGLARRAGDNIAVFDTSSGLLSPGITALFADSKGNLWIGSENGITIYSGARSWTRYRFPGSIVYSFAEQSNGVVWIGTNRGVITHRAGRGEGPEWKTYHSKNALRNDFVRSIAACGKDMWLATDNAVQQYAFAERQVLFFYEQLLPSFRFPDLWHGFPAVVIPTEDWGTFGFSLKYMNMGSHEQWDDLERWLGEARAWEGVLGVSYGLPVREDLSLGLSAKYVLSVLDASSGGIGQTFAVDVGVLKRNFLINKFDVGFMLQNMGPSIYYTTPENADPIPFSLRLGLAYRPIQTPFHELNLVFDAYREVVNNTEDGPDPFWVALWTGMLNNKDPESSFKREVQEINLSFGLEYTYADFMALRSGLLVDYLGERYELSLGLGVKYANMNFDFSYIHSPYGFFGGVLRMMNEEKMGSEGTRDGQWRISLLFGF